MTSTSPVTTIDAGPRVLSRRIVVDAPAGELFDLVADPRRHQELDGSGTVRTTVSGPDRLSLGSKFSVNMRLVGAPYRIANKVTAFEDGVLLEWRHPFGHRWRWQFAQVAPGRTEVTETWDYRTTPMAKFFEVFGFPAMNDKGIGRTLEQLRDRYAKD